VLIVALATACSSGDSEQPAEEGRSISGAGLELTVPTAWDGRLYLADDVSPVVQAASFPLAPTDAYFPDDPPPDAFGEDGVYVALMNIGDVSYGGVPPTRRPLRWETPTLPLTVARSHFDHQDEALGLSVATRYVIVYGRAFILRVALASDDPSNDLLAAANDVLSTLSVTEWRPDECPPNWPGPWTACPEADWVRLIAETAGYRITDETGSALVTEGHGDGFYIHATPMSEKHFVVTARREEWPRRGRVEGVEIFGEDIWRWWRAQGFVFWLHAGPTADATLPTLGELPALVRASLDLPPPD
jgi:hypothetical protein